MIDRDLKPHNIDMGELGVGCPTCAAKPGERCASLINAANYREPHAGRRARAAHDIGCRGGGDVH